MSLNTNTLASITPTEHANLILEPLLQESIPTRADVATVRVTGNHEVRIPIVVADAVAGWVAEGAEIGLTDIDVDELTITPTKAATLIPFTRELADDSSPDAATTIGASITRALVDTVNRAFLGDLPAPAPAGLASLDAATTVTATLANLDGVHEAKSLIATAGGTASSIIMHPTDELKLATLKDTTGSNRSLIESTAAVAGLPVVVTKHATAGQLWIVDNTSIHTVVRSDITLTRSDEMYFSSDRVAVRGVIRIGFGFPYPNRVVRLNTSGK